MSEKKWTVFLIVLFVAFICLFFQFISSAYKNLNLIRQLNESEIGKNIEPHIMLISQELNNPYWRKVGQGASDAADELGMLLEYVAPMRIDVDEQVILLEKAIASKVDAILIQGIENNTYTQLINRAIAQGIPVITVDADSPESERVTYVGSDNFQAGLTLGEIVAQNKSNGAKIGVIRGSNLAANQIQRLEGFRSVISKHQDLEIIDIRNSNISRIEAAQQAIEMVSLHQEIDTMIGLSALDAVGIMQGLKTIGRTDITIYSFDELEETKKAIAEGEIEATIAQKPYTMGYEAVYLAQKILGGEHIPRNHFIEVNVIQSTDWRN